MPDMSDEALEATLRHALHEEAASLPAGPWRETVRRKVRIRLHHRGRDRRLFLLPGLAAALVLGLGAWLTGSSVTPATAYEAVFVQRGLAQETIYLDLGTEPLHVVTVASGRERELAVVPVSAFEVWYHLNHIGEVAISPTGRLAIHAVGKADRVTSVVDLAQPEAEVVTYPYEALTFDPAGDIWLPEPDAFTIVDPVTRRSRTIPIEGKPAVGLDVDSMSFGPFLADGSGILASDRAARMEGGLGGPAAIAVIEVDGSATGSVGALDWHGERWLSPDGRQIGMCAERLTAEWRSNPMLTHCPDGVPSGTIVALSPTSGPVVWLGARDEIPSGAEVIDASWDADGRGMWLWVRAAASGGPSSQLIHIQRPGGSLEEVEQVASIVLSLPTTSSLILGLAPDDSLIAIGPFGDRAQDQPTALVDTATGSVSYH